MNEEMNKQSIKTMESLRPLVQHLADTCRVIGSEYLKAQANAKGDITSQDMKLIMKGTKATGIAQQFEAINKLIKDWVDAGN